MRDIRQAFLCSSQFWAWSAESAANPIPDDHAINNLLLLDNFGAQPGMDGGPDSFSWIAAAICANTPDEKLLGAVWPLVDC